MLGCLCSSSLLCRPALFPSFFPFFLGGFGRDCVGVVAGSSEELTGVTPFVGIVELGCDSTLSMAASRGTPVTGWLSSAILKRYSPEMVILDWGKIISLGFMNDVVRAIYALLSIWSVCMLPQYCVNRLALLTKRSRLGNRILAVNTKVPAPADYHRHTLKLS